MTSQHLFPPTTSTAKSKQKGRPKRRLGSLFVFALLFWGCAPKPPVKPEVEPSPPQICCGGEVHPSASPKASDISTIDLGSISQGETVHSSISIKNESDKPISLVGELEYSLPCCFHPQAGFQEIEPGKSGNISLEFDSKYRPGPIDLFLTVPLSSGDRQFHFRALVTESIKVWPTGMRFQKKGSKVPLRISGDDLGAGFEVLEVYNPHPNKLKIEGPRKTEQGLEFEGTWIGTETDAAIFTLEVRTTHPLVPVYPVSVAPPGAKV